jgi:hypothetical protein
MVSGFPLEAMHTLYLVVGKHFLETILETISVGMVVEEHGNQARVNRKAILNSRIAQCHKICPSEFDRRVTSTNFFGEWKATTFRHFFLYLAYPLLEDLVDDELLELIAYFQYFIYLIGGADSCPVEECDLKFAQEIIEYWVTEFLYMTKGTGNRPMIHYLLHVVEDCRKHETQYDVLSVFTYENEMRFLRPLVKSGNKKLEQVRNRLLEASKYIFNRDQNGRIIRTESGNLSMGWTERDDSSKRKYKFVFTRGKYQKLIFGGVEISTAVRDSFVLIHDFSLAQASSRPVVFQLHEVLEDKETKQLTLVGYTFSKCKELFTTPEDSRKKHVYAFSEKCNQIATFPVSSIVAKLYAVPRFSKLGVRRCSNEMLGVSKNDKKAVNFSKIEEWVGIAERHVLGRFSDASLY